MDVVAQTPKTGTRRTRVNRVSRTGQIYHIVTSAARREPIFSGFLNARSVVRSLMRTDREKLSTTLAFVVMPDHLHWLMELHERKLLSICVGSMKSYSARLIHRQNRSSGAVWQRGYFDRAIRRDEDLVSVSRYIVANPLRAGIVDSIGDYAHWDAVWMNGADRRAETNAS